MEIVMQPGQEIEETAIIGFDPVLRIKGLIMRVEDMIRLEKFSPESLWREFFDMALKESGSYGLIIQLLKDYGYTDVVIIQLLKLIGLEYKAIFDILAEAGWRDVRIASAIVNLSNQKGIDLFVGVRIKIDLISFFLASGIKASRVVAVLYRVDCLTQDAFNGLFERNWTEFYLLVAIIEAGRLDSRTYNSLMLLTDKYGRQRFSDSSIIEWLVLLEMPDSEIILIFGGVGKTVSEICTLCKHANWSQKRTVEACVKVGYSPGDVAFICVGNDLLENSRFAGKRKKIETGESNENASNRATVIKILKQLGLSDSAVYKEVDEYLGKLECAREQSVDYFLTVGWTPKRILAAMLKSGISEFRITAMLNKFQVDFKMKRNKFWTEETVRLWKNALKKLVTRDLAAIFG